MNRVHARLALLVLAAGSAVGLALHAHAQPGQMPPGAEPKDEFRPFAEVAKGYDKVNSNADGSGTFYGIWVDHKKNRMIAELPRGYEGQRHFFALTISSGEDYAGLQAGDLLVYWKRQDNHMLLMEPNLDTKSTGDNESKASVKRLFTDRVLLDLPILALGPTGQPVIDMSDLLAGHASNFFGRGGNARLASITKAKAFPENVELAFEMPTAGGRLQIFYYSISLLKGTPGYKPREADERVGYFTTVYRDLGKFTDQEKWVRYINRWALEKRDPRLKLSPPKKPITFYIENTVPVRYRRFVEQGILAWNKAYEKVGILNAIEVQQQDAETGTHMDKDPEDVRWNFIRWLANDAGTAIGPSRTDPNTGEILDADIILTDGWIRYFWNNYTQVLPQMAMEGMTPETLEWLGQHPDWDPRVQLAPPDQRDQVIAQMAQKGVTAYGGHAMYAAALNHSEHLVGNREFDGLFNRHSQINGLCMAATGKAFDVAAMRMHLEMLGLDSRETGTGTDARAADAPGGSKADLLDGIPDWFIGQLLADLVCHEVGHTLGLRHNFKASSIYTLDKINSPDVKGKKPFAGSVMDYIPINMNIPSAEEMAKSDAAEAKADGEKKDDKKEGDKKEPKLALKPQDKGDYAMIDVGPYDFWAIEYGYTAGDTKEVLKRVAEPELVYATDEDTGGPDPLARRYDFAADPIAYAKNQADLAKFHRARLLDKFVKDGDSWAKARRGYEMTLGMQTRGVNIMAAWIGGAFVNRDRKGDPNARPPIQVVPVAQQREALAFVIENSFKDESFGLTPELLQRMTVDKWLDAGGFGEGMQEATWPVHDRIKGIQATALTLVMNPTTLRRVYDNEFRIPADQDAFTLPELIDTVYKAVWSELDNLPSSSSARKPAISSLRRDLQREHAERLIDLSLKGIGNNAASKPVQTLATAKLRDLQNKLKAYVSDNGNPKNLDPYTAAHLAELKHRIDKVLDAQYLYNPATVNSGGYGGMFFQQPAKPTGASITIPNTDGE